MNDNFMITFGSANRTKDYVVGSLFTIMTIKLVVSSEGHNIV